MSEILLPPNFAEPNRELFGDDAWVWSANHRDRFLTPAGPVRGSEVGLNAVEATALGRSAKWLLTANGGVSGGASGGQPIKSAAAGYTVVVVARPQFVSTVQCFFSQRAGAAAKEIVRAGFNQSAAGVGLAGSLTALSYDGSARSITALANIDGNTHCWVLANSTDRGYIFEDGLELALTTDVRPTTGSYTAAQTWRVGGLSEYATAGLVHTDPLLLVAVIPRVIPNAQAARISRLLSKSLAPAFEPRRVFVAPLVAGITASASDTATFGDSAVASRDRLASASDSVTLSDSAALVTDRLASASDTLSLSDSAASVTGIPAAASDTLPLSDSAESLVSMIASASDGVSLSDVAVALSERIAGAVDSLSLTDSAAASISGPGVTAAVASDAVAFSDSAEAVGPHQPAPALPIAAKLLGPAPRKQRNILSAPAKLPPPEPEAPLPTVEVLADVLRKAQAPREEPAQVDEAGPTKTVAQPSLTAMALEAAARKAAEERIIAAELAAEQVAQAAIDKAMDNNRRRAILLALLMADE